MIQIMRALNSKEHSADIFTRTLTIAKRSEKTPSQISLTVM